MSEEQAPQESSAPVRLGEFVPTALKGSERSLFVRAYSRRHSTLCRVSRDASGVRVQATPLPDLLMHFTIYGAADSEDAAKRRIDHEISQLRESGS